MAHEVLWYGLGGFAFLLIVYLGIYFIFRNLIKTYIELNQGWYFTGLIVSATLGFYLSKSISTTVCYGVPLFYFCTNAMKMIFAVGSALLFWSITKPKGRTTQ